MYQEQQYITPHPNDVLVRLIRRRLIVIENKGARDHALTTAVARLSILSIHVFHSNHVFLLF